MATTTLCVVDLHRDQEGGDAPAVDLGLELTVLATLARSTGAWSSSTDPVPAVVIAAIGTDQRGLDVVVPTHRGRHRQQRAEFGLTPCRAAGSLTSAPPPGGRWPAPAARTRCAPTPAPNG